MVFVEFGKSQDFFISIILYKERVNLLVTLNF